MVIIEMENGSKIKIELYPEIAPITCENFEKLVNKGFYMVGILFPVVVVDLVLLVVFSNRICNNK